MRINFDLETEWIKLGQLLKAAGVADSGAMAKQMIEDNVVYVNGQMENRRGKKIYMNDIVTIDLEEMDEIYVSQGAEVK